MQGDGCIWKDELEAHEWIGCRNTKIATRKIGLATLHCVSRLSRAPVAFYLICLLIPLRKYIRSCVRLRGHPNMMRVCTYINHTHNPHHVPCCV
jgi:hypothetical protein